MSFFSTKNGYVRSLKSFRTLGNLKLYLIALVKDLKSVLLNGGKVDKHITSIISGNEPIALLLIKPFNTTFGHYNSPPLLSGLT